VIDRPTWEAQPKKNRGEEPDIGGWELIYKGPCLETPISSFGSDIMMKGTPLQAGRTRRQPSCASVDIVNMDSVEKHQDENHNKSQVRILSQETQITRTESTAAPEPRVRHKRAPAREPFTPTASSIRSSTRAEAKVGRSIIPVARVDLTEMATLALQKPLAVRTLDAMGLPVDQAIYGHASVGGNKARAETAPGESIALTGRAVPNCLLRNV
jgi:hypothetical protein